jgi:hypothetical protein
MLLCYREIVMRTTIDMPDALFRRTKAIAAARGVTLKQIIVNAVEHEINQPRPAVKGRRAPKLPLIHLEPGRTLDLTDFDFDDLLT